MVNTASYGIPEGTVRKYGTENNAVYASFIDLSKAFERINHEILHIKLTHKVVSLIFKEIFKPTFKQSQISVEFTLLEYW